MFRDPNKSNTGLLAEGEVRPEDMDAMRERIAASEGDLLDAVLNGGYDEMQRAKLTAAAVAEGLVPPESLEEAVEAEPAVVRASKKLVAA
jgi:hypothetical protein